MRIRFRHKNRKYDVVLRDYVRWNDISLPPDNFEAKGFGVAGAYVKITTEQREYLIPANHILCIISEENNGNTD